MELRLIAKFSLLDNDGVYKGDVEVGKKIDAGDMEYSISEQYDELREKATVSTPDLNVVDLLENKERKAEANKIYRELNDLYKKREPLIQFPSFLSMAAFFSLLTIRIDDFEQTNGLNMMLTVLCAFVASFSWIGTIVTLSDFLSIFKKIDPLVLKKIHASGDFFEFFKTEMKNKKEIRNYHFYRAYGKYQSKKGSNWKN